MRDRWPKAIKQLIEHPEWAVKLSIRDIGGGTVQGRHVPYAGKHPIRLMLIGIQRAERRGRVLYLGALPQEGRWRITLANVAHAWVNGYPETRLIWVLFDLGGVIYVQSEIPGQITVLLKDIGKVSRYFPVWMDGNSVTRMLKYSTLQATTGRLDRGKVWRFYHEETSSPFTTRGLQDLRKVFRLREANGKQRTEGSGWLRMNRIWRMDHDQVANYYRCWDSNYTLLNRENGRRPTGVRNGARNMVITDGEVWG